MYDRRHGETKRRRDERTEENKIGENSEKLWKIKTTYMYLCLYFIKHK